MVKANFQEKIVHETKGSPKLVRFNKKRKSVALNQTNWEETMHILDNEAKSHHVRVNF